MDAASRDNAKDKEPAMGTSSRRAASAIATVSLLPALPPALAEAVGAD